MDIVDIVPLPMGVVDAEGKILAFNAEFTQAFGYTVADIPSLDVWWQVAYPDDAYRAVVLREWEQRVAEAQAHGGAVRAGEYRVTCKSGEEKLVRITGSTTGGVVYALFDDLTESRAAEERNRERLEFSQAVIDAAADGICVCHEIPDPPFVRFTVWSRRMVGITGYTMEEINQAGWYQSLYPDPEVRQRAIDRMARMRDGDNMLAEHWTIARKGGAQREIAISTSIVAGPAGSVHVLGIMHDMTDALRERERHRALEEKVWETQRLESLGILAGGIAHDFNNLLVAVLGHAELGAAGVPPGSPLAGHLRAIETAACRASELTNQLMAYSGQGRFVVGPTRLNDVVSEMNQLLAATIPKSVNLVVDLDPQIPWIEADSAQMRQVVMNLLTNAAEATMGGAGTVRLTTTSCKLATGQRREGVGDLAIEAGEFVVLRVEDDGAGMPPATQERIFDPFFTTKFTGRGLGLAAVLGIVRGHRGALFVHSVVGEGTSFELWLPALVAPASKHAPPAAEAPVDLKGRRALVVDDEPWVRTMLIEMLGTLGIDASTAADGQQALETIESGDTDFDVVLLDLTMPRMGGRETLTTLRARRPDLPVLFMSGYSAEEMGARLGNVERTSFLQKPFSMKALSQMLGRVIGTHGPASDRTSRMDR